jgi:predicted RNA binding protein YcfA (HicA-like mRNA interferase family)
VTEYPAVGSRKVKRALLRAGWHPRRGRGHTVFSKGTRTVVVDDDVKRFSPKLLALMRRQAGLDRDAFIAFLRGGER